MSEVSEKTMFAALRDADDGDMLMVAWPAGAFGGTGERSYDVFVKDAFGWIQHREGHPTAPPYRYKNLASLARDFYYETWVIM